ncbi:Lrp/AsnC family transcriptional regulator [Henriciella aquimarina]|uniref:Lrp/AsnC family transcriptional regulator n=1 Tax=Henriciella aquimarina TaxID=545261 RepID=UPI000A05F9D9|nr:Lrp/AsnC family transcriptional regulator [Henriciella aquimarina]
MHHNLDRIDCRLLQELQQDCSRSAAELGELVELSQASCWRRIQRLEEQGFIRKRIALVDPEKIGLSTIVLAHVKLSAHGRANLDIFSKKLRALPNVLECFVLLGDPDFFLKVAVKDIYDYERFFFDTLSKIEGVAEVKSMVALSQIKNETAFPVTMVQAG